MSGAAGDALRARSLRRSRQVGGTGAAGRRSPGPGLLRPRRMRLYNTLTRREEPFTPVRGRTVRMYTCGLTVYARGHIGNFRTFVALDVLRRTLKHVAGFDVRQVMNFTDVDDRTIVESKAAKVPLREYTDRFIAAFREDAASLGLEPVEAYPRATDEENLRSMVEMIRALEANGHTYRSDGSVYFRIATLPDYGKLARLDHDGMKPGAAHRLGPLRQGRRTRLRALEGDRAGRADVGLRGGAGASRVAHRVLGDGPPPARRVHHRHPRRRCRPRISASRERDRPVGGSHLPALLAVLGPRRAPAARRGRQDVEVARQRLHRARRDRARIPGLGPALRAAVGPLPQATAVHVGWARPGRGGPEAGHGVPRPARRHPRRRRASGGGGAGRGGAARLRRPAGRRPERTGRASG